MSQQQVSTTSTKDTKSIEWETAQRVVFPSGLDASLWPLYVDWGVTPSNAAVSVMSDERSEAHSRCSARQPHRPPAKFSRRSIVVPAGERLSLASYFNAFPASYWQRWTDVQRVRFDIETTGNATIALMRSSARGTFTTIDSAVGQGEFSFEVSLNRFGDGGWLWVELDAAEEDVELISAKWSVPSNGRTGRTHLTVGITTVNMPAECISQAHRFFAEPDVLERVAEIVIADQGTKHVKEAPGYEEVRAELGSKLRVIEQSNLGGSGGFSRGMYEMLNNPASDYVLILDDDAEIEPESALRAIEFADHALRPTIVGGQMFNLNERTTLHSMGEWVNPRTFWWESVDAELKEVDLAQRTIRTDSALNRRTDVNYTGWWMCLIPREIIEKIGLSMPFFIKWDDAEYALRAREHGFPTVSLPGSAVWHVPWTEKDDGLDWQAYFHQRNRLVSALLHSVGLHGGGLPAASCALDIQHLLSLQYYPEDLRLTALEDVLRGPDHLIPSLLGRAGECRARSKDFADGRLITGEVSTPDSVRQSPLIRRRFPPKPRSLVLFGLKAVKGALRQLRPLDDSVVQNPQALVANADARWWNLSELDAALVTNAGGSGSWLYQRDPVLFRSSVLRSVRLHAKLIASWQRLADEYRAALHDVTSPRSWERVFGITQP